ncbi:hypothetical protein SAMN04487905_11250 [Actinopolyspora xinjiangensis]|uniref:Excreted virulence factor EspC, type VII ESX diderm n=2 Tax=Actinopolyspora TaxID=1849 RepID=A0A1G8ZN74_ACTMZ|nr:MULTISPECIES: hypothetical protein [Actinopolyspora]SDK16508.1 hypothetical protein SAMN04487820_10537 [Actinopolyspora mzabensis]SDP89700.1 hypothetical protein SAMN04487905_11250 [Actinopolyspora xinjiangensis]
MAEQSADASGFVGAGAALQSIRDENSWIQQQISGGGLSMEPQAADKAAEVYLREAGKVDELIDAAIGLQQVPGLGAYTSGQQLAAKFGNKARNGSNGAADLLEQFADELRRKADLFKQAKKNYQATDEQAADDLRRGAQ